MKFNHLTKFLKKIHAFITKGKERACFCSQSWFANTFGRSVSTILRWVRKLKDLGWITVAKQGQSSAEYFVTPAGIEALNSKSDRSNSRSDDRSEPRSNKEVFDFKVLNNPMGRDLNSKTVESIQAPSVSQKGSQMQPMNIGYTEDFQEYIGVFRNAHKPLNEFDYRKAYAVWGGYDMPARQAATKHAKELAADLQKRGANPKYLPFPVNHLLDQPWTRTVEMKAESVDDEYERYGYRRLGS